MTRLQTQAAGDTETSYFSDGSRAVVFSFIGGGFFFPCVVVINPEGTVEEFIPLSSHGERIIRQVPPGILQIYTRRIERNTL
jgi:hypothetical protein